MRSVQIRFIIEPVGVVEESWTWCDRGSRHFPRSPPGASLDEASRG